MGIDVAFYLDRSSQRPTPTVRAKRPSGFRRLLAHDRAVMLFTNRRRPVLLSEWRGALDALSDLHKFAGVVVRPPVAERAATPALTSRGRGSLRPDAAAWPRSLVSCSDPSLAAAHAPGATCPVARSTY